MNQPLHIIGEHDQLANGQRLDINYETKTVRLDRRPILYTFGVALLSAEHSKRRLGINRK